ncbi:AAA family ATPase [Psychrobacter aestuarii]|uniref:AAA family ATPase n=2 Tax=Psychrobacter aestuarii TaxID=556327 RepID=A0ABP3FAG5_9GAMM
MTNEVIDSIKLWFHEDITEFNSEDGLKKENPFELKRFNIIVGANNSGKSRFMRELGITIFNNNARYRQLSSFIDILDEASSIFKDNIPNAIPNVDKSTSYSITNIISEYQTTMNTINYYIEHLKKKHYPRGYFNQNPFLYKVYELRQSNDNDREDLLKNLKNLNSRILDLSDREDIKAVMRKSVFYINNLRSLKSLANGNRKNIVEQDSIVHPLLNCVAEDYQFSEKQIISGEDFFDFLADSLLGMPNERQNVVDYQKLLSRYFFNNQEVTIIPNRTSNTLQIKIGEDQQFPISNLGDGLQQVIILTYKAFLIKEPTFFLIEEPEMHLHAGYVKQVVKFLMNETSHYYMATTHSNYLLDMINEDQRIALYRVDREQNEENPQQYETIIKRCDNDRTILRTLGVSPSSVFLANCTIWVEGITDRLYFVQYLRKYLEELKTTDEELWKDYSRFIDGYHYAFVEYQGSNLDHWDFEVDCPDDVNSSFDKGLPALLTTSHALVIADADLRDKPRFTELQNQLNDNMIVTQGKETENTLPTNLLKKKFFSMCPENGLSNQGRKKKLENFEEYDKYFDSTHETSDLGIGDYLNNILEAMRTDEILPPIPEDKNSFTFSDGGQKTIKNKSDFCRDIVGLMEEEEWTLTESARLICEKIFEHIKRNNS